MSELRWHPLLREWVQVGSKRQHRPQMPSDWCPFCPGAGGVPAQYDVLLYANDFAAFSESYPPFENTPGLFRSTGARGVCDVVLYHSDHNLLPARMTGAHWRLVVDLWRERTARLFAHPGVEFVHIFENAGAAIGVTMPHPHGQIYALPFVPPLVDRELISSREYFTKHRECIYCTLLRDELSAGVRMVMDTEHFVAFVPFHARWPGEIQIYPRRHFGSLTDLTGTEMEWLARCIKAVRMKYDNLWGFSIPLMMIIRQQPARGGHPYFHFHVEFFPIQRSATKLKYLAGVESGMGTFLNDTVAEEKAAELRQIDPVFA